MSDDDKEMAACKERYLKAAHAVQSGVTMLISLGLTKSHEPKHLRTGLDLRAADQEGLARLLIDKRVITELEYYRAMADAAEREKRSYEKSLSEHFGKPVTLG